MTQARKIIARGGWIVSLLSSCGTAVLALVLASCGGDDPKPGSIRFALTDAAGCGFDQVNVTVDRIRDGASFVTGENLFVAGGAQIPGRREGAAKTSG